jgi:PAS domain S-box-containing protein
MKNLYRISLFASAINFVFALITLTDAGKHFALLLLGAEDLEVNELFFYVLGGTFLLIAIVLLFLSISLLKQGVKAIKNLSTDIDKFVEGANLNYETLPKGLIAPITERIKKLIFIINNATHVIKNINDQELTKKLLGKDKISLAIKDMQSNLISLKKEEDLRNRALKFSQTINQIIQNHQNDIFELGKRCLSSIASEFKGQKAKLYFVRNNNDGAKIHQIASYAEAFNKDNPHIFELGEGLVGQAVKDNKFHYTDQAPENFSTISSGLGESKPQTILIVPIQRNQQVYGAIELLSLYPISDNEIEILNQLGESLAATFMAWRNKEENDKLLEDSQELAASLREKEAELLRQQGFLKKAQDTLKDKLVMLEDETSYSKSIIEAIDRSNAAISFSPEGTILEVNNMFCSVMGFDPKELIGEPESIILPEDERNSMRHNLMWESLKTGASFTGDFKRLTNAKAEVWLNGSYNPIFNAKGEIVKIILFAQFTTEQKEAEIEHKAKLKGYERSIMAVTFKPDASILSVNELFSEVTGLKRLQLKRYDFSRILPNEDGTEMEVFNRVIETKEPAEYSGKLNLKGMEGVSIDAVLQPVPNIEGRISKVIVLIKNGQPISALKND